MNWFLRAIGIKSTTDIVSAFIGAGFEKAGIEAQLDAMDAGQSALFAAPAALLVRSVIKRGGYVYDITGYQLRKRTP